jgi:hypothetical protein
MSDFESCNVEPFTSKGMTFKRKLMKCSSCCRRSTNLDGYSTNSKFSTYDVPAILLSTMRAYLEFMTYDVFEKSNMRLTKISLSSKVIRDVPDNLRECVAT